MNPISKTILGVTTLTLGACSSAGPTSTSQTSERASAADQYGYKFDNDNAKLAATAPAATAPTTNAQGRLAPEAIQSVVRQSFGAYRQCYESALKTNAQLQGTVTVSFVIAPDGSTMNAADHGSSLPDAGVIQCVVSGFSRLAFPPPQGGYVTVVYPVAFSPGD
jgi:hypothetical protein